MHAYNINQNSICSFTYKHINTNLLFHISTVYALLNILVRFVLNICPLHSLSILPFSFSFAFLSPSLVSFTFYSPLFSSFLLHHLIFSFYFFSLFFISPSLPLNNQSHLKNCFFKNHIKIYHE